MSVTSWFGVLFLLFALDVAVLSSASQVLFFTCDNHNKKGLLSFTSQPESLCLPSDGIYKSMCGGVRVGYSDQSGINIGWHAVPLSEENKDIQSLVDDSNSTITLTCAENSCAFKVWCTLRDGSNEIRSKTAFIKFGESLNNVKNSSISWSFLENQKPEPLSGILKADLFTNVTLPCLLVVPYPPKEFYFSTHWLHNGRNLFPGDDGKVTFEGDGSFSVLRTVVQKFFLWTNLTIFHVEPRHAGYYQCFTGDDGSFNNILLDVSIPGSVNDSLSNTNDSVEMLTISHVFYHPPLLNITFPLPIEYVMMNSMKLYIGIIRQHSILDVLSGDIAKPFIDCSANQQSSGSETMFANIVKIDGNKAGNTTTATIVIPASSLIDRLICRKFYSYAVFVKLLSFEANSAVLSRHYILDNRLGLDEQSNSAAIDNANSGMNYACINDRNRISLFNIEDRAPPRMHINSTVELKVIEDCYCDENITSYSTVFKTKHFPVILNSLSPTVSYCIISDGHCIEYPVGEGSLFRKEFVSYLYQSLTFERLADGFIISWKMTSCQWSPSFFTWYMSLRSFPDDGTNTPMVPVEFMCSGRVIFSNVSNPTYRHNAALVFKKTQEKNGTLEPFLSVTIPGVLLIDNLTALVVSQSQIILSWIVIGFDNYAIENKHAVFVTYYIYACLPDTVVPHKTNGIMNRNVLKCLGCQKACSISTSSIIPGDVIHALPTNYDPFVTKFQFIVWAEVSLRDEERNETLSDLPVGEVGRINVTLSNSDIDRHRPLNVRIFERRFVNQQLTDYVDWTISWQSPKWFLNTLKLVSYMITIAPLHRYFGYGTSRETITKMTKPGQTSIFISRIPSQLLRRRKRALVNSCENIDIYVVQVMPIWIWTGAATNTNTSADGGDGDILVNGPVSFPYFHQLNNKTNFLDIQRLLVEGSDYYNQKYRARFTTVNNDLLFSDIWFPIVIIVLSFFVFLITAMHLIYHRQLARFNARYGRFSLRIGNEVQQLVPASENIALGLTSSSTAEGGSQFLSSSPPTALTIN